MIIIPCLKNVTQTFKEKVKMTREMVQVRCLRVIFTFSSNLLLKIKKIAYDYRMQKQNVDIEEKLNRYTYLK